MSGREAVGDLLALVETCRRQDAVRALGLVPLAGERDADILTRYGAIQEYIRGARQFGSQRQASEKRAAEIAMANLARTAGYPDPLRISWAMEGRALADIAAAPLSARAGEVEVALAIDEQGAPQLSVTKAGRALKAVPAGARREAEIKALSDRAAQIRRQRSRMQRSLEKLMVRGDPLTGEELRELCRHPVLHPSLRALVLHGEGIAGYPSDGGRSLRDHAGARHALGAGELLTIAHPVDLLAAGDWPAWQRDLIVRRERQPFKQLFRELYVLTDRERADVSFSTRYAGHQLQPRAELAQLGGRGWVAHPEEGIRRTSHDAGLTASLWFDGGFGTPLETECPALEQVRFTHATSPLPVALSDVPPRIFSEVMRDLHRGSRQPASRARVPPVRRRRSEDRRGDRQGAAARARS